MPRSPLLAALVLFLSTTARADDYAPFTPTFDHAVCTCANLGGAGALTVSGHDSDASVGVAPASIGVDGVLQNGKAITAGGGLYVSGSGTNHLGALQVGGDMFVQGVLNGSGSGQVGGDMWLHDRTTFAGHLQVGGKTKLAPQASVHVGLGSVPVTHAADFDVANPCACDANATAFISSTIRAHAHSNDNARIALDPNALHNVQRTVRLLLPAGVYFVSSITSADEIDLVAEGDVTLLVAGDVIAPNKFHVVSARGGRLDMHVGGNFAVGPNFFFGNARAPGHARLYIAGAFHPSGVLNLAGNLYAPHADVALSAQSRVRGSVWLHTLTHSAPLSVVYDAAVGAKR